MDGIETAERIRTAFDIPVIFLSAFADDETLQRAKVSEPFGYIVKPFEQIHLQTTIETARYKHQMERRLKESEQRFVATLKCLAEAVIATDTHGRITFLNPAAELLTAWTQADALGRPAQEVFRLIETGTGKPIEGFQGITEQLIDNRPAQTLLRNRHGVDIPIEPSAALIKGVQGSLLGMVLILVDISGRKAAEAERENLIAELKEALTNVKTLSGLLPICAHCKKIRDDTGYWNQIESYISRYSGAEFTHGICPDCRKVFFPEFDTTA
jgi:PAS domain S-box-containing protein